jgi:acetyl-CoA carboxylase carboxyltransferase component
MNSNNKTTGGKYRCYHTSINVDVVAKSERQAIAVVRRMYGFIPEFVEKQPIKIKDMSLHKRGAYLHSRRFTYEDLC